MQEFIQKLGVDWRLLVSQAVNFLLLIVILRLFAYKPIVRLLNARKRKIQEGIYKTEEADRRLSQANAMMQAKVKEGEEKMLAMLREAETRGKKMESRIMGEAEQKALVAMQNAERAIKGKEEEMARKVKEEAAALVKEALIKTVELDPRSVDEALIKKALAEIK